MSAVWQVSIPARQMMLWATTRRRLFAESRLATGCRFAGGPHGGECGIAERQRQHVCHAPLDGCHALSQQSSGSHWRHRQLAS